MRDPLPEPSRTRQLQPQASDTTTATSGFYEYRQSEKNSLDSILAGLRKYWYVIPLVSSILMAGVIYKTAKEPRIYKSGIQIAVEVNNNNNSVADKIGGASGSNPFSYYEDRSVALETTIQKLKSKTFLTKAIETIPDPKLRPDLDTLANNLTIQQVKNSNILDIGYTDRVPSKIVPLLNSLSKVYLDFSIKDKKIRIDKSITFVEVQLPESRKRLALVSKKLENFRRKYRFINPESSANGLAEYRQEIVKKLNVNKVEYDRLQQQYSGLKEQLTKVGLKTEGNLSTTMLTQDSTYQELFKKLNELELGYSQEKLRLTDTNPIVIRLKEKRDDVLVLLKKRAREVLNREVPDTELTNGGIANFGNSLAQTLANKQAELETNLVAQVAEYQGLTTVYQQIEAQIDRLPALQEQYTELQRQYTIGSQELTAFLQKLQEFRIADAEQVVPWTLLDPPAVPKSPIFPNVNQQLSLGAIGSLFVGVLAAYAVSKLDRRIDNANTVKSMTGMPLLAAIPKVDDFDLVTMRAGILSHTNSKHKNYSYWSFVEAIRILALGLGLTTDRADVWGGKAIAITSSVPKEGKSSIAFHTSLALADLGYRVLLVDADLHKSSISQLCQRSSLFETVDCSIDAGLSNVLLQEHDWKDLIKKCPDSSLDVLFAGSQSVNSIAMFNSQRFKRLIETWKKEYDYILFDTPPIIGISDTHLISTLVDGLVYVVSLKSAQPSTIDAGVDILSSLQTPVLGLVINHVENSRSGYHKYYQYYQKNSDLALPSPQENSQLAKIGSLDNEHNL